MKTERNRFSEFLGKLHAIDKWTESVEEMPRTNKTEKLLNSLKKKRDLLLSDDKTVVK